MLILVSCKFRFRLIQPEDPDSLFIIVFSDFLPHVMPGVRTGDIDQRRVAQLPDSFSPLRSDKISFLCHFLIIDALLLHGRPDGNHELNSHLFQLTHHPSGVRPVFRVKIPVSLMRPVEVIHDNDINRKIPALIFPRSLQNLLLRLVAKLALPESEPILRHHGNLSRYIRIMMLNFCRCVRRSDPVIQLLCGFRIPFRQILSKRHSPDGWIIPEHPIAAA